eukprot:974652-Amphidinium_carterae.2
MEGWNTYFGITSRYVEEATLHHQVACGLRLLEVQLESEKQGTEELRLARDRLLADVASNK